MPSSRVPDDACREVRERIKMLNPDTGFAGNAAHHFQGDLAIDQVFARLRAT